MKRCIAVVLILLGSLALIGVVVTTATAQTQTVYNSIPKPLPANVGSEGPEAYGFAELGDGLDLAGTTGTISQVTVIMSSWACQSGSWTDNYPNGTTGNICVTSAGATFSQPITVNIYGVDNTTSPPTSTGLLATTTQTFNIPYRPSSTPAQCGGDPQRWYNSKDKTCYHGLAVPISANFSGSHLPIPANSRIIVTVAFNTTDFGPAPIGQTACNSTNAGCPYDSLNISTDSNGGNYTVIGSVLDVNGVFVNYTIPNTSCSGTAPPTVIGSVAFDTPCWSGFHPEIQVTANTNATHHSKGNGP